MAQTNCPSPPYTQVPLYWETTGDIISGLDDSIVSFKSITKYGVYNYSKYLYVNTYIPIKKTVDHLTTRSNIYEHRTRTIKIRWSGSI